MEQERYETIDRLYRAALSVEPRRRSAFLTGACRGDESLRLEVEALLGLEQQADAFVKQPLSQFEARVYGTSDASSFSPSDIVAGRFEIVRFISRGGMGDVYEARDLQLGEHVALKTIRPEFASNQRMITLFKQEILLAKRVTHPNVCRIYDVGFHLEEGEQANLPGTTMFLTMELLPGEPLSSRLEAGPMAPSEALPIVEQMAAGLDAAHRVGVVHRDFKSANVLLVPSPDRQTRAVITDFGLAHQVESDQFATISLTQARIVGTPEYMAPEQLTGGEITAAADIYALGIVMYEMIAGRRPFQADSAFATAAQRLHQDPPSPRRFIPDLDRRWEAAILKCLERDPLKRFASASEVLDALGGPEPKSTRLASLIDRRRLLYTGLASAGVLGVAGGAAVLWRFLRDPVPSIAILPLTNSHSDLDYVSDGITEDLINTLGQRTTLRVMSRAAVYRFKGSNLGPRELGRVLNVQFLLTGRVLQKGNNTSIAVELTDTETGVHLWGQQYERPVSEVSAVEEDISREVLGKLQLEFGPDDRKRLAGRRSVNAEANELYWKGRYFWNKRTQQGFKNGIEYFNRAIAKDPGFALAYTGLADCYAMQSGVFPPAEVFPKAKSAAEKALDLDETLAEAHASLGFTHLFFDWDWLQTEKQYQRAIQLNPNYASAHSMYGMYLVAMSRFDEALVQMKRALQLDPVSLAINTGVGRVLFYARRYREAAAQYTKTLELDSNFPEALFDFGRTRAAEGRFDEAIRLLERGLTFSQDGGALAEIIYVHRRAQHLKEAKLWDESLQELTRKRYVSPYFHAIAQIGSNNEEALELLQQAYNDRSFSMIYLNVDPHFDPLRPDPRYRQLLQRLGFRVS